MASESSPEDQTTSPASTPPAAPEGGPAYASPQSSPTPTISFDETAQMDSVATAPVTMAGAPTQAPNETPPVRLGNGAAASLMDIDYENQTTRIEPGVATKTDQRLHVSRDAVVVSQDQLDAINPPRSEGPPSLAVSSPPPPPYGATDTSLVDLGEALADERDDEEARPAWWNIALLLLPILLALGGYGLWHTLSGDDSVADSTSTESESDISVGVDTGDDDTSSGDTGSPVESESDVSIGVDTDEDGNNTDEDGNNTDDETRTPIESESDVSIGVDTDEDGNTDDETRTPTESESDVSIGVDTDEDGNTDDETRTPTESESDVSIGVDTDEEDGDEGDDSGSGFDFSETGGGSSANGGGSDSGSSGGLGGFSESDADSTTSTSSNGGSGGGNGGGTDTGGSGGGNGGGTNTGGSGGGNGGGTDTGGSGGGSGGGGGQTASVNFEAEYGPIAPATASRDYTFKKYKVPDTAVSFELPDAYKERSYEISGSEVTVNTFSNDDLDWHASGVYVSVYGSADVDDRIEQDASSIAASEECETTETTKTPLVENDYPDLYFADPITVGDWEGSYAYFIYCQASGEPIDFVNIVFDTDDGLVDITGRIENEQDLIAIDRLLETLTL